MTGSLQLLGRCRAVAIAYQVSEAVSDLSHLSDMALFDEGPANPSQVDLPARGGVATQVPLPPHQSSVDEPRPASVIA